MNKERAEAIREWSEKGAEWCATQLWNARKKAADAGQAIKMYQREAWKERGERNFAYQIKKDNEHLKEILEENGIRPKKLRVYYRDADCPNCENNPENGGEWDCAYCEDDSRQMVESISWYTYKIDDGYITGITSAFKSEDYECYKITDENTGEVLYECKEEEK